MALGLEINNLTNSPIVIKYKGTIFSIKGIKNGVTYIGKIHRMHDPVMIEQVAIITIGVVDALISIEVDIVV